MRELNIDSKRLSGALCRLVSIMDELDYGENRQLCAWLPRLQGHLECGNW